MIRVLSHNPVAEELVAALQMGQQINRLYNLANIAG